MKRVLIGFVAVIGVLATAVFCLIGFGTAPPPPPLASVTAPFSSLDYSTVPAIERYAARDGAQLSFLRYPSFGKQVAVLIHGSAGGASSMHAMATALQHEGITAYVPDLRGHGANLPRGDIAYIGQLDDDMADFVRFLQQRHPGAPVALVGFSSGGGFALRIAAGPSGQFFSRYILLSPFLRYDAPTVRKADAAAGHHAQWTSVSSGRIVGLSMLNGFGIHWLDGLPVIHFAVPPETPNITTSYSWRLQQSFQPHNDYMADIRAVSRPMQVFVGSEDEMFVPEQFSAVFGADPNAQVTILPGLGHSQMATDARAVQTVAQALKR